MNGIDLQDRIYRAAGRSAAVAGTACDLFRPRDPFYPMAPENRILRLPAVFVPLGGSLRRPVPQTSPYWEGLFDAAYSRPGDILRRDSDGAIFFIASQQPLLPIMCVRAQHRVTLSRPASPANAGLNLYGGATSATDTLLARDWPGSLLLTTGSGTGLANIQAELAPAAWEVLLPTSLHLALRVGDRLTDDQGRTGVIATAETNESGTRLLVRQAST